MRPLALSAFLGPLALAAVLGLGGPAGAQTNPEGLGHDLVRRNCGMCHAVGRADSSEHASAPPFRRLNKRYPLENLEEALAEGILTGHPDMPQFTFGPEAVSAIIQYLKSIQDEQGAQANPIPPVVLPSP